MDNYENIKVVRAPAVGEVTKMTDPQLQEAWSILLKTNKPLPTLLNEIHGLRKQVNELGHMNLKLKNVKEKVNHLSSSLNQAFTVITQQHAAVY